MPSTREGALQALTDRLIAALPGRKVERSDNLPETIPDAGYIAVMDGEPGDPEETFSPHLLHYEHRAEVAVLMAGLDLDLRLDAALRDIGAALAGDRTLNGAVEWLQLGAPDMTGLAIDGAPGIKGASVPVTLIYTVSGGNPLD